MKRGSKYYPLYSKLRQSTHNEVTLTFAEIEKMLRRKLPASARTKRAWWSNRKNRGAQADAWLVAGYKMVAVDLAAETVTFRKPGTGLKVERKGDTIIWNGELIKALRYHMDLSQAKMAQKLGVGQQTISDWETSAHRPKPSIFKKLTRIAEQVNFRST